MNIKNFLDKIRGKWRSQPPQYLIVFFLIVSSFITIKNGNRMWNEWVLIGIFTLINLFLARIDADKIKAGKKIYHGVNGVIYGILICFSFFITHSYLTIISLAILRIPVFNTALNVMRGLPATYVSKNTTSLIDKWTYRIIEKLGYWTYNVIILGIAILLICL
jgi:uncharacterized membrane protein YozB (DUF420 family)